MSFGALRVAATDKRGHVGGGARSRPDRKRLVIAQVRSSSTVRLADDREVLLVGDLVWMMPGLAMNRQKPQAPSNEIQEDRAAIQREIDWVRSLIDAGAIAVTPSHDKRQLDALVARGVLRLGLDLRRN